MTTPFEALAELVGCAIAASDEMHEHKGTDPTYGEIGREVIETLAQRGQQIVPIVTDEKLREALTVLDKFIAEHNPHDPLDQELIAALPTIEAALSELQARRDADTTPTATQEW